MREKEINENGNRRENKRNRDLLIQYLRRIGGVLCVGIFSIGIFGLVFVLGNLDARYFAMGAEAILLILIIYAIVFFFVYKKQKTIGEQLHMLQKENEELRETSIEERKDLQEYFLTWVHQIKTPITASQLLLTELESSNQESDDYNIREKNLEELKKELLYIDDYAGMALNYLKLINHQRDMDVLPVTLDKILRPIIKKYARLFISNRITLEYESLETTVITDAKWLSVLVEQIISNAIKYTKNGTVSIYFEETTRSLVIEDTGVGIRAEDIPKIFDKGYSGFNGRLNEKASGIGLYLAREIAKKLSITISVESQIGKGSLFFLSFNQ